METLRTARAIARADIEAKIKAEARRQIATVGAPALSLRAVARELGMVSSAIYRYFPSRDELLTALIVDAYDDLGAHAEKAAERAAAESPAIQWRAVARAIRSWAVARPFEYALIYGSPVPGYRAPESTTGPAARVAFALVEPLRRVKRPHPPAQRSVPETLRAELTKLAADLGVDIGPDHVARVVAAYTNVFGLVSFELFGHLKNVIDHNSSFFDYAVDRLGTELGL